MNGEVIDKIMVDVDGVQMSRERLEIIDTEPSPAALAVGGLQGIVDYLRANVDELDAHELILQVVDPWEVRLIGSLTGPTNKRHTFIKATAEDLFGRGKDWMDQEVFTIFLQTCFVNTAALAEVQKLTGSLTEGKEKQLDDDGLTQRVAVKAGVSLSQTKVVKSPVTLAPYRTFREVEQVGTPYVLRLARGTDTTPPMLRLFEADGGAWKLSATARVAEWLRKETSDLREALGAPLAIIV